jgi:hypothetical protein
LLFSPATISVFPSANVFARTTSRSRAAGGYAPAVHETKVVRQMPQTAAAATTSDTIGHTTRLKANGVVAGQGRVFKRALALRGEIRRAGWFIN